MEELFKQDDPSSKKEKTLKLLFQRFILINFFHRSNSTNTQA